MLGVGLAWSIPVQRWKGSELQEVSRPGDERWECQAQLSLLWGQMID
jgi:hypothetical protein